MQERNKHTEEDCNEGRGGGSLEGSRQGGGKRGIGVVLIVRFPSVSPEIS